MYCELDAIIVVVPADHEQILRALGSLSPGSSFNIRDHPRSEGFFLQRDAHDKVQHSIILPKQEGAILHRK